MRSAALLAFVIAAVSTTGYAAPIAATFCDRNPITCMDLSRMPKIIHPLLGSGSGSPAGNATRRDVFELITRAIEDEESGALKSTRTKTKTPVPWASILGEVIPPLASIIPNIIHPTAQPTFVAPTPVASTEPAAPTSTDGPAPADEPASTDGSTPAEPASTDEPAPTDTPSDDTQPTPTRRELVELLARAAAEDESGSLNIWGWIPKIIEQIPKILSPGDSAPAGNSTRRDVVQLLVRTAEDENESGAFNTPANIPWGLILPWIHHIAPPSRRELVGLLARAAAEDESEAVNWGGIVGKVGPWVIQHLPDLIPGSQSQPTDTTDSTGSTTRRALEELLARADEDDSESGAINWPGIVKQVGPWVIKHLPDLIPGSQSQPTDPTGTDSTNSTTRRALAELLVRADEDNSESGAINWPGIVKQVGPWVIKHLPDLIPGGSSEPSGNSTRRAFDDLD